MRVTAIVQNVEQSDATSVTCSPIGGEFTTVDDPAVRDSLRVMWAISNVSAPVADRREQGFWIFRNPSGDFALVRMVPTPGEPWTATTISPLPPVQSDLPPGFDVNRDLLAAVHSHPVEPWTVLPEGKETRGGPSPEDWKASKSFSDWVGRIVPLFIVDHSRIWRVSTDPATDARSREHTPRVSGSCVRV